MTSVAPEPSIKATANDLQKLVESALDSRAKGTVDTGVLAVMDKLVGGLANTAQGLETDAEVGIVADKGMSIEQRREVFGQNSLPERPLQSLLSRMLDAAQDPTVIILAICAILSLALGMGVERCYSTGWVEGCAILIAIVVVVNVSAINDYQKDMQFRALNAVKDDVEINIIRNGKQQRISTHDVVVGDVVELCVGDMICADGLFLFGHGLKVSEAAMTGESDDLKKGDYIFDGNNDDAEMKQCPFLFGGTMVMEGTGRMVVLAVGTHSYIGSTRAKMQETTEVTSVLEAKLNALAEAIGKVAMLVGGLVLLVLIIRMAVKFGTKVEGYTSWDSSVHFQEILGFVITAVTVLVVAVPEGLPLAVVISLAFSVKKMLKDNNLVRHLAACETMGGATTICSDKTGTLTMNRMTVTKAWSSEVLVDADGEGLPSHVKSLICEAVALNSSARLEFPVAGPPEHIGNKTECGLLQFCHAMKTSYVEVRAKRASIHPRIFAFSSSRKRMSTLWDYGDGTYRLFTKGAPEALLDLCSNVLDENGQPCPMSVTLKNRLIEEVIESFARDSLRTLCVASRTYTAADLPNSDKAEDFEVNLTCLCIVGIEDPVRPEVPDALIACRQAGITVRMVTGDNISTARAIAGKCGIAAQMESYVAMEGRQFRELVQDANGDLIQSEIDKIWPTLLVLARSSPLDKHTLVSGIMASTATDLRQVVAVTGDGTNDGPALKKADVGFAMGITGTSVAKDAADIILMDDNFTSIVKAVKWGRCVYDNICKFLQFQLTVNVSAVAIAFIGSCILSESPLRAIHLLWINLIMDSLASLALATEGPTDSLLLRKPYGRTKPLLSPCMLRNMTFHGVFQIIIVCIIVWCFDTWLDIPSGRPSQSESTDSDKCANHPTAHYTIVFNAYVLMQLFNEINCRRINNEWNVFENLFKEPYFAGVVGVTMILQVILVEFGDVAFSTTPLTGSQWGICLAIGLFEMVWYQIMRFCPTGMFNRLSYLLVVEVEEEEKKEDEEKKKKETAGHEVSTAAAPDADSGGGGGGVSSDRHAGGTEMSELSSP